MNSFNQGWCDRLRGLPPQARRRLTTEVEYERGRHCAALWQFYVNGQSTITSHGGVESDTTFCNKWSYEAAISYMPDELLLAIEHEKRFCATLNQRLGL